MVEHYRVGNRRVRIRWKNRRAQRSRRRDEPDDDVAVVGRNRTVGESGLTPASRTETESTYGNDPEPFDFNASGKLRP